MPSHLNIEESQEKNLKILVFTLVVFFAFSILIFQLLHLQWIEFEANHQRAEENRIRKVNIKALRGYILDRNGIELVRNRPSYQVNLLYHRLAEKDSVFNRLLNIRDSAGNRLLDSAKVAFSFDRGRWQKFRPQNLIEDASMPVVALFEEMSEHLQGIEISVEARRDYPYGEHGAHIFGYTGEISEEDLAKPENAHYTMGDRVGKSGLELSYEQEFKGENGLKYIEVNAFGREIDLMTDMPFIEPISGNTLVTTIDWRLQEIAENAMLDSLKGALVALNPQNGEIYAMVSRPPLDPNIFSMERNEFRKAWASVALDSAHPLNNRAIKGLYPPASVFKIFTAAAGLDYGIISEYTKYHKQCFGGFQFGKRYAKCWKPAGHGALNVVGALRESCDVYFYQAGLEVGAQRIGETCRRFGLGSFLGIDIPGEKAGFLVDSVSFENRFKRLGWKWTQGEVLNIAIGQGALLVTPLQQAASVGALVSGKGLYRPHFMKEVRSPKGKLIKKFIPEKISEAKISSKAREIVLKGMYEVVNAPHGTGRRAIVQGVKVGGKTGSAENPHGDKTHAWFVAAAPLDDAEIVISVVLENAGGGGAMAAPIAQKVLNAYFHPDSSKTEKE